VNSIKDLQMFNVRAGCYPASVMSVVWLLPNTMQHVLGWVTVSSAIVLHICFAVGDFSQTHAAQSCFEFVRAYSNTQRLFSASEYHLNTQVWPQNE